MADFNDLRTRVISAIVMLVIGIGAIWWGGEVFVFFAVAVTALMAWELSRMLLARHAALGEPSARQGFLGLPVALPVAHGVLSGVIVQIVSSGILGLSWTALSAMILAALLMSLTLRHDRGIFAAYLSLILVAGFGMIQLRGLNVGGHDLGLRLVILLVLIVIASDVGGYFGGRILGGPKFWPRISPKKTWSGTVVGWVLAMIVMALFQLYANRYDVPRFHTEIGWPVIFAVPLAFVGQLGDIAESAIKRYCGIKDSSNLIPGHGGVLDRFDALIAVVALATVLLIGAVTMITLSLG